VKFFFINCVRIFFFFLLLSSTDFILLYLLFTTSKLNHKNWRESRKFLFISHSTLQCFFWISHFVFYIIKIDEEFPLRTFVFLRKELKKSRKSIKWNLQKMLLRFPSWRQHQFDVNIKFKIEFYSLVSSKFLLKAFSIDVVVHRQRFRR
jgi:hypothetical protein